MVRERSKKITASGQILMDHVRELRTRILICVAVLVVGGVIGYAFLMVTDEYPSFSL